MGLTASSTGKNLLNDELIEMQKNCDYTVAFAGNPNVGKSTIFNSLTGMHQHTGNWPGKTVSNASGTCTYMNKKFLLIDLPGTYSLLSNSGEEEIAREYICFGKPNVTVVIVDGTVLERNLNLVFQTMEITKNVIVCINLLDEVKKKNIDIDLKALENYLGVPVIGTTARKPKTIDKLLDCIYKVCIYKKKCNPKYIKYEPSIEDAILEINSELSLKSDEYIKRWISLKLLDSDDKILNSIEKNLDINLHTKKISNTVCTFKNKDYNLRNKKIDKILTSKKYGIPIMILFLGIIFWLTIVGANYPSQLLSNFFNYIQDKLLYLFNILHIPTFITELLINGMYKTVAWVVSVMLPPMAIFFPMFTLLEDLGYLPRIAFNLDNYFKKACTTGKQALTMCMGFGCNAAGVVGCKIIDSPREKLIAMLTNAFVPCNRKISSTYNYCYYIYWKLLCSVLLHQLYLQYVFYLL